MLFYFLWGEVVLVCMCLLGSVSMIFFFSMNTYRREEWRRKQESRMSRVYSVCENQFMELTL